MTELLRRQMLFTRLIGLLIEWSYQNGYTLTCGDGYRDPRVFGPAGVKMGYGHPKSAHKNRLAHDFNLFKNGKWLQNTEDFAPLGEFWESLDPLCRWGGRFKDGNHFSIEYEGMM